MNLKKLVAALVSASVLATTAIVTPVVANAENDVTVTVNVDTDWFSGVIFTDAAVDVTVNQNDKTGEYWLQVDRQTAGADNDYTAAFGSSSEDGYTQSFTFSTDMTSVSATLVSYSNAYSKNIAYTVTIDTTKATDGALNIGVKGNGDPASEQTNNWYYVTPCELEVIADDGGSEEEAGKPLESGTTDDGTEYRQLPADDSTSTNNTQGYDSSARTEIDDKTYAQVLGSGETWRIYRAVRTEDLANYSSASVVIKNGDTGKAFKLTTSTVYEVLNAGDQPTEGVVYVVFVINNVSGSAENSGSYISDLVWSDITLE